MKRSVGKDNNQLSSGQEIQTVGDAVYLQLREDLLGGNHAPGSRLYSEELKTTYECGVSPLREALSRLAAEHLVTKVGQKGFRAAEISLSEMWDITNLRILNEGEAFRQSILNGDTDWEERIVASFHGLSKSPAPHSSDGASAEWERRHRKFHQALLSACESPWLINVVTLLQNHSERYRRIRLDLTDDKLIGTRALKQHELLMQAALDRDQSEAGRLYKAHIESTAKIVANSMTN